jgi:hypothetical protein
MMWREGKGERAQLHVIEGWQHLASFDSGDEDALRNWRRRPDGGFDMDAYRILTRQLRDARLLPLPKLPARDGDESWN